MYKYIWQIIVLPGIVTIAWFYGHEILADPSPSPRNPEIPQTKLESVSLLLNKNGTPEEYGYMTLPLKVFNEENLLPWQKLRLKKWDHFDVITDRFMLSLSVADVFYIGEARLDYFDFTTKQHKSFKKTFLPNNIPRLSHASHRFTGGRIVICAGSPSNVLLFVESEADNIVIESGDLTLRIENRPGKDSTKYHNRYIFVNCESLDLRLDFKMTPTPQQEAMVAVIPLTEEKQHFFYTVKMPNIESEGKLKVADQEHLITKENAGGFIDWGRGVWTYNTYWVFARAQGFLDNGKRISLNFASGYGDEEINEATEDAFFIDDVMIKLNVVEAKFDDNNLMNPWTFKTVGGSKKNFKECEITFAPFYRDRKALNLFFLKSEMRTTYGQYSGWVTDQNNKKYTFENLNGFAEIYKDNLPMNRDISAYSSIKGNAVYPFWDATPSSASFYANPLQNIVITVSDPVMEGDMPNRHITYTIKGSDMEGNFEVKRRYSDFDKIRALLVLRWPGCYVPPLPPKKTINNLDVAFVEDRRKALEDFLMKLAGILFLHYSEEYQLFLRSDKTDIDKVLHKYQTISYEEIIIQYKKIFTHLAGKELNNETVLKIASFRTFLKGIQESFSSFKKASKEAIEARKAFYAGFAEFHQIACEEYERNILAEYHDHKEDIFVFNNAKDTIKFQEKIEKIKEGSENNSIESLCVWIKGEKIEIEAFLEAIAQRDKYDALKNKVQEKQSLLSVEIQNIIGGKSSIKSFLLGKSKEDEVAVLDKQLAECCVEVERLTILHDMITLILAYNEIEKFKNGKKEKYYQIVKVAATKEKENLKKVIEYWSDIMNNENVKSAETIRIDKIEGVETKSPKK